MLTYLGGISYTLYLEHLAIICVLQSVYGFLGLKAQLSTVANIPVTVAACILTAALSSRFLEHDLPRLLLRVNRATSMTPRSFPVFPLPAQPVDATQALNFSAGVSNCKVSRGRSFS